MFTLEIDEATPSNNRLLRKHWSVDRRTKKRWRLLVLVALSNVPYQLRDKPLERARITITRFSYKRLDKDNLEGGVKHALDALKACNVIVDDSDEHVDLVVRQEYGKRHTRIVVEPWT